VHKILCQYSVQIETDAIKARAAHGVEMADYADDNGVSVFTVSFGADPLQHAYNASLARGIGTAYNTPDKNQLTAILSDIAGKIPISIVK